MAPGRKENLKTTALMTTGFLTEFALIQSMMRSKTLTVMVILGIAFFLVFFCFLLKMA